MRSGQIQHCHPDHGPHSPRAAVRSKLFRLANLLTAHGAERAHLLDVSETGARLHCATRLAAGDEVAIAAAGVTARGRIVWAEGGRLGLRFHRRLGADELARLLAPLAAAL